MIDPDLVDCLYESVEPELKREIQQAILRLPTDVAVFAVDRCHFTAVGNGTNGLTLPGRVCVHPHDKAWSKRWVIVLLDDPGRYGEELQSTVAHELAHAWRGEHVLRVGCALDAEEQTALLARSWGFTGHAAQPDNFKLSAIIPEDRL